MALRLSDIRQNLCFSKKHGCSLASEPLRMPFLQFPLHACTRPLPAPRVPVSSLVFTAVVHMITVLGTEEQLSKHPSHEQMKITHSFLDF